ncbi:Hint domain-containing protein [Algicella marina]|uniref:Hedgehog/Intein (Hint) domain-containing protein n=1 Tax=Algicella marina TaxID=2683284 RepID=A0A6P1T197_9RHOB|nr:Hint domain-containing protein [Algicella marina]QHQ36684.1 hypothetical protein GO499_16640 [Algicella marina]
MPTLLQEDFEDATLTFSASAPDDLTDAAARNYYGIVTEGDLPADISYGGVQGTRYYSVHDTDNATNPVDSITLTFDTIDITNFENLTVSGLFAEDDATNGDEDWDMTSSVRIEVSIDGGPYVPVLAFESADGGGGDFTNEEARQDTNFDGIGDGPALTSTFTGFSGAISGTGSTLDMRIVIEDLNAADEDVAFDDITVSGDAVCFTPGTMIETPTGPRLIEDLMPGDLVMTRDSGAKPLCWIGRRTLCRERLAENPRLRPVLIRKGALSDGLPLRDMRVSRHHGMLVYGWRAKALFGLPEALVAAVDLINETTVVVDHEIAQVEYIHLLFDSHEIVMAEGAWSESYQPLARDLTFFDARQEREILALFPELAAGEPRAFAPARPHLGKMEAKELA